MSPEVDLAHALGYEGQGVAVILVDRFSGIPLWAKVDYWGFATHGELMRRMVKDVAPRASVFSIQQGVNQPAVTFTGPALKVVNLSLRLPRLPDSHVPVGAQFGSITYASHSGLIVTIKSAGNGGIPLGAKYPDGKIDIISELLKTSPTVIFAGALERNGAPGLKAQRADYSNYAGFDPVYQSRTLFVGVNADILINAAGTSSAAATLSGYAAVVGSKFTKASPTQVANQLLTTARQDTIANYQPAVYGRGEASLARALAPASLK